MGAVAELAKEVAMEPVEDLTVDLALPHGHQTSVPRVVASHLDSSRQAHTWNDLDSLPVRRNHWVPLPRGVRSWVGAALDSLLLPVIVWVWTDSRISSTKEHLEEAHSLLVAVDMSRTLGCEPEPVLTEDARTRRWLERVDPMPDAVAMNQAVLKMMPVVTCTVTVLGEQDRLAA